MTNETFVYRSRMPAIATEAFAWHMRQGAFQRLAPLWDHLRVLDDGHPIGEGSRAEIELSLGPLRRRWTAEHRDIEPGRRFRDVQIRGPFARCGCAGGPFRRPSTEMDYASFRGS